MLTAPRVRDLLVRRLANDLGQQSNSSTRGSKSSPSLEPLALDLRCDRVRR